MKKKKEIMQETSEEQAPEKKRKFRFLSIVVILLNVYFIISEIVNFSQTKSSVSLFAILMYASTFLYLLVLEIYWTKQKSAFYAYFFTFFYLIFNALLNPFVVFFGKAGGLSSVYSLASFMPAYVAVFAYLLYLIIRIVSSLLKSFISLIKRDIYARCRYFSIIISTIYTLMVFILNLIVTVISTFAGKSFDDASSAHSFDFSEAGMGFFIAFYIPVAILSLIFAILCIGGMIITRVHNKRKQKKELMSDFDGQ